MKQTDKCQNVLKSTKLVDKCEYCGLSEDKHPNYTDVGECLQFIKSHSQTHVSDRSCNVRASEEGKYKTPIVADDTSSVPYTPLKQKRIQGLLRTDKCYSRKEILSALNGYKNVLNYAQPLQDICEKCEDYYGTLFTNENLCPECLLDKWFPILDEVKD